MSEPQIDLTSPEAVAAGQEVYDRIESGECTDVTAELDKAYGRNKTSPSECPQELGGMSDAQLLRAAQVAGDNFFPAREAAYLAELARRQGEKGSQ